MKMRSLLYILLFAATLLFSCSKDPVTPANKLDCATFDNPDFKANPKSDQYQALIDDYVKKGIPGVILLIKDDNGFYVGSSGMADIDKGIKMQPCHVSKIASITKFMLGITIFKLQEKGVLSIDDKVSKYIDTDILNKIENGNEDLKIKNLMNHTSGIYDVIKDQGFYLQVLNNPSKEWTPLQLLEFVYGKPAMFKFSPEDTAAYSNTNYTLLAMIVEKATGKPQSQVMHEELIDPLGLNDTYYFYHDALPEGQIAQGYYDLYNNGTLMNLSNWNTGSGNGYGGVYSTVWDMYLIMHALFESNTLLSQESMDQMFTFHKTIESRKHLGLACFKDFIDIGTENDYAIGHRGRDLSYSADLFYFPNHHATMAMIVNYGTDGDTYLRPVFKEMRDKIAEVIISEN